MPKKVSTKGEHRSLKDVVWVGDSREQVQQFPKGARRTVGQALRFAQRGDKHPKAKPMTGIGPGVLEIVARHGTDTYRAVYAVSVGERIYVLHCFQKKSTKGIKTPKKEIDLIKQRLRQAKQMEAADE